MIKGIVSHQVSTSNIYSNLGRNQPTNICVVEFGEAAEISLFDGSPFCVLPNELIVL